MRFSKFFAPIACFCAATLSVQAAPSPAEIIAKAREKVGSETQLAAVKTLVLEGKLSDKDGKQLAYIETYSKLPKMRYEYTTQTSPNGTTMEVFSASNGLEGYLKFVRAGRHQTKPFSLQEIARNTDRLQSETSFFAKPTNGTVTFDAEITQQGKACYALLYKYAGGLFVRRFFDKQTYELVAEETYQIEDAPANKRLLSVFEGEISPAGAALRFPRKVTHYEDGKLNGVIEYNKVLVNSEIADSKFSFPIVLP